ncbi:MAG: stage III sporulation protein AE [Limnochordia bacterium]|jgi:stage III sporulation protein AE|nr:stage III sporulation protein AE [Bacillota bacterium]HOB08074.1 stage III sporulation protein AE [Limnochordia bacterium]HPT92453.1 stage III sporulation protein AE [Limnochordia bacterium]HPZ30231.1 stage III sporulation protein AE [Limnochordia bacterium]HQD70209.1 stage III sporulation protein AE [Limnochordia bacterium]
MPPKSRMVFIILTACLITAWVGESLAASGPDYDEILAQSVQEQLRALELDQLSAFASKIEPDYQQYIPNLDWRAVFSQSSNSFNLIEVLAAMLQTAFKEVIISSRLMRQLLLIGLLTALIRQLQLSVENKELANAAFLACFLVAIYIGLQSFRAALELAYQTVDDMVSFMYALLPLLSTMVASVGGITSAAIFHPVLITVVSGIAVLIRTILFPLINVSAVIGVVAQIAPDYPLTRLSGLLRHLATMLLSLAFTVFLGVLAVRGAVAPVADGVALRTAKFITSNVVPVIGSMFANAVEVVVGGSLLIKNTIGAFGMVMIFFLVALPIVKIWAIVLIYKLAAALIEPIGDQRVCAAVSSMAGSLTLVMVSLATAALMFFLTVTILVGIGNLAAVMR